MTAPPGQTWLLARTFFGRAFESDLMPPGLPQVQVVITAIAFLAAPAALLPVYMAKRYVWISDPVVMRTSMTQDRLLALVFMMLATAGVTLVIWENVFPDRRDSRALGVLPIPYRRFVLARLAAITWLFGLLFVGTTVLWATCFTTVQSMFGAPGGFLRNLAGHFAAMMGAEALVFFGILAVQCALLTAVGPALAQRTAIVTQIALMVLALQMPMLLPPRSAFVPVGGAAPPWTETSRVWALPAVWFLALHEWIATGDYDRTRAAGAAAGTAAAAVPLLALALYAASYRRLTRLAIEGRPQARGSSRARRAHAVGRLTRLFARGQVQAAVCAFTLRTLARSRQHRMLLALWVGLALALIVSTLIPFWVRSGAAALERPRAALLVAPLILTALTQTGIRMLFAVPTEIKANWIFRLSEPVRVQDAIAGAAAALVVAGVLPAVLLAFVSGTWLWGLAVGVKHALFCGALGVLLAQVLMRGIDKVPFTCTYVPGKARLTKLWAGYLTIFSFYTFSMAALEVDLLRWPVAYTVITAGVAAAALVLAWMRHHDTRQLGGLRFEEEPLDSLTTVSFVGR